MADNAGFSNVELPGGSSEKELRASLWFVNNREKLRKIGYGVFIGIDAIFMLIGIWGFVDWLAVSGVNEHRNVITIASSAYAQAPQDGEAQEIKIETPLVFSGGSGKYDIVSVVSNPNAMFWIELQYQFTVGDKDTPLRAGFILPGQEKKIAELGFQHDGALGDVQMKVVKRAFHRVDRHAIPKVDEWLTARLNMPATNAKFIEPQAGATVPTSETTFTITNQTAYSFYDVPFNVFVYRGDGLVGANRVTFSNFKAGEKKSVDLFWYQNLPGVTRVEVVPDLNLFDPSVYKVPGA